jgi:hypothetical protein
MIDGVRAIIPRDNLQKLVSDIESPGRDGLPAVWEMALAYGLSRVAKLEYERPVASGKCPDFYLPEFNAWVEVKTVSDDGEHDRAKLRFFEAELAKQASKLFGNSNGIDIKFESNARPDDKSWPFSASKQEISKITRLEMRTLAQFRAEHPGENYTSDTDLGGGSLSLKFNPSQLTHTVSFPKYTDLGPPKDQPAYARLQSARRQLGKGTPGELRIIVLCDGGADAWRAADIRGKPARIYELAQAYLHQTSSIDFIICCAVRMRAEGSGVFQLGRVRRMECITLSKDDPTIGGIPELFNMAMAQFDEPVQDSWNAGRNKNRSARNTGFSEGYKMSSSTLRISSRQFAEILAGKIPATSLNGRNFDGSYQTVGPQKMFETMLKAGRMIKSIRVISEPAKDDDWIEIEFGVRDPAIAPLRC